MDAVRLSQLAAVERSSDPRFPFVLPRTNQTSLFHPLNCRQSLRAALGQACNIPRISTDASSFSPSRPATASEAATYARMTFKLC